MIKLIEDINNYLRNKSQERTNLSMTPTSSRKRISRSTTPSSSDVARSDNGANRKKCQMRNCNGNKAYETCNKCNRIIFHLFCPCLTEEKIISSSLIFSKT
ncbi:hypothetical protein BpHYR1_030301 [Brachionus plicatilis]|uniref:Uncharacterized protein n=1 Tax=Brachionus plicatilis TaxID=10195 RepID=A0A3M7PVH6_BRAPC|nr:hypothetical protein BpHYR1_030301 [Brachionus plicatilis]